MKATIIVARSNSRRLPYKILKKITENLRVIDILISRSKKIGRQVILATTNLKSDNKLVNYVQRKYKRVVIYRGENKNKIKRWFDCFNKFNIDYANIIDGDDVYFDYLKYKKEIKKELNFEIISNQKKMITGLFTHIISHNALNKMKKFYKNNYDTEMIDNFLQLSGVKRKYIKSKKIFLNKKIRLTLDYKEDLELFRHIGKKFSPTVNSEKIIRYLINNPEFTRINYFREKYWRKDQYKKNKFVFNKFKI